MKKTKSKDIQRELADLLNQDEVRSRIIRDAAFFDLILMVTIGMYFCPEERTLEFYELIGENLSLNAKINILNKIKFKKKYRSLECVHVMRRLQRLRNIVAHKHYVSHFENALFDHDLIKLLRNYPGSYDTLVKRAKNQLRRLSNTQELLKYQICDGTKA